MTKSTKENVTVNKLYSELILDSDWSGILYN